MIIYARAGNYEGGVVEMLIEEFDGKRPDIHESVFVAKGAVLVGDVTIGKNSSVWYCAVARGDENSLQIGEDTNIQDSSVIHASHENRCVIGNRVTVGHSAVIHGATIEDDCIVGISATVLDGARIGAGSIVGAGSVVSPGKVFAPRSMLMGVPARVVREISDAEYQGNLISASAYAERAARYKATGRL